MADLPDPDPEHLPEFLPDDTEADDPFLEAYRDSLYDRIEQTLQREAQSHFMAELLRTIRQANEPRPLVILEREEADFLRNLLLDLLANNKSARYTVERLRIGLDLLDGRHWEG